VLRVVWRLWWYRNRNRPLGENIPYLMRCAHLNGFTFYLLILVGLLISRSLDSRSTRDKFGSSAVLRFLTAILLGQPNVRTIVLTRTVWCLSASSSVPKYLHTHTLTISPSHHYQQSLLLSPKTKTAFSRLGPMCRLLYALYACRCPPTPYYPYIELCEPIARRRGQFQREWDPRMGGGHRVP
jgi:hypothetical protein